MSQDLIDEPDNETECLDGYPEHDYKTVYDGEDGWQGECRRCGAEAWEDA